MLGMNSISIRSPQAFRSILEFIIQSALSNLFFLDCNCNRLCRTLVMTGNLIELSLEVISESEVVIVDFIIFARSV